MFNKVILIGRVTKDLELKKGSNDNSFAPFTIAVNRQFSNANGDREVDFINCIAFNKQAENLVKYCAKGSLVAVSGRLQNRSYQAQDGTNRTVTEVISDNVIFLTAKPKEQESENSTRVNEEDFWDMVASNKGNHPF